MSTKSAWERAQAHTQVRRMYRDGYSLEAISNETGYTDRHVYRILNECPRRIERMTPGRKAEILKFGRRGLAINDVVRRTGAHKRTVRKYFVEAGIPIRKQGLRYGPKPMVA